MWTQKFFMYLIFDTSALAQPRSWKAPVTDVFSWPRMLHISWIVLDADLKPIEDYNCLIKPKGFQITESAAEKHHLDIEKVTNSGDDLAQVLTKFSESVDRVEYIFSHNLKFNENIVGAEFIRSGIKHNLFKSEKYCLMQEGTYYCKLPGKRGGYKWPSLQEMHTILFRQKFSPSNNARADVIAASRCFIKLMRVNAFEDIF